MAVCQRHLAQNDGRCGVRGAGAGVRGEVAGVVVVQGALNASIVHTPPPRQIPSRRAGLLFAGVISLRMTGAPGFEEPFDCAQDRPVRVYEVRWRE